MFDSILPFLIYNIKKEKSGMIPNLLADITKYKGSECCGKWQDFVVLA